MKFAHGERVGVFSERRRSNCTCWVIFCIFIEKTGTLYAVKQQCHLSLCMSNQISKCNDMLDIRFRIESIDTLIQAKKT